MEDQEIEKLNNLESNWWFKAKDNLILSMVKKLPCSGPVLDVGCCSGRLLKKLSVFFCSDSLHGVDPSSLAVRIAGEEMGIDIKQGNIENLEYEPSSFELVITSDVLEHTEDDKGAYEELLRVLKPNGRLIITVPAHQWLWSSHDEILDHKRRYSMSTLKALLNRDNTVIEKIGYYYGLLFPVFMISRLLDWFNKAGAESKHEFLPGLVNNLLNKLTEFELKYLKLPFGSTIYTQIRKI